MYLFVILSQGEPKITPLFGTCDDGPKITRNEEEIILEMRTKEDKSKKYTYRNGLVVEVNDIKN